MKPHTREVSLPELGLLAGTRAALGAGLGLLLAGKLSDGQRLGAGWALLAVGALTTIPLALEILGKDRADAGDESRNGVHTARRRNVHTAA